MEKNVIYKKRKEENKINKINSIQNWLPFDKVLDNRYN